jgi:hypothetical protein
MAHRVFTSSCRIDRTWWRVWLVAMLTCQTMTASQFMCKFPRSSSRWQCTNSCAQSPVSWPLACFTAVFLCSTLVPDLIPLEILRAVTCSYLKGQRERRMYGGISAQKRRYVPISTIRSAQFQFSCANLLSRPVFLLRQPVSAHHCSTSISRSISPLYGSANAFLIRSLNRSPFPLLPHASSALPFSRLRSKRQSET